MNMIENIISQLMKHRFFILCFCVFGIMFLHTQNGQWIGDFWEHSAVVRELATHILNPKHPHLLLDSPHAFYSPYAVIVALISRMLHLDAVMALSIMGLVNLGLWFLGLRLFVFSIMPKHQNTTVFYSLLLTLFWWGSNPWGYSGFFHIDVLGYVTPYPSTFAAALTLIALGLNQLRIKNKNRLLVIPIFFIAVTVLISHPITFLFLAVGLFSQSCVEIESILYEMMLVATLLSLTFLVACLWPYFPLLKLFMVESSGYHSGNQMMYQQVISRIWPSLIGVPLVIVGIRSNRRRPLILMLLFLSVIYVVGAISEKYSYGRVISYIVLLLHITIAEHLSILEVRMREIRAWSCVRQLVFPASVVILVLFFSLRPLKNTFVRAFSEQPPPYEPYLFLSQFVDQYDVVLSDIWSSWMVPTFGGKIIATVHPMAFVPDQNVRRADLDRFFSSKSVFRERQQIIKKYKVNYLLIRKESNIDEQDLHRFQGQVEFQNDIFMLIRMKSFSEKDLTT